LPQDLQKLDLDEVLQKSEQFAIDEVIPALTRGGFLADDKKKQLADKMAYFSGLTAKDFLDNNLSVSTNYFWKHLLKDVSGHNIGRLDSRYLGIDKRLSGTSPDYSAELTSWLHSFTPAINHYFREELKYETDLKYNMFGNVNPWNNENDNTRDNLRQAMAQNPYLNVLFQTGYYDGATTYFNAKYTMWHIDPSGQMKDRFQFKGYRSGHMMYLRKEDLKTSNDDLRTFILKTFKVGGVAKY
jgi:carboxypeptidase C (cathepsin A)